MCKDLSSASPLLLCWLGFASFLTEPIALTSQITLTLHTTQLLVSFIFLIMQNRSHGCQDCIPTMVFIVHRPSHNSCSIFCHAFPFMCQQLVVSLANYSYLMYYVVFYPCVFLHWTKNAHTFYLLSSLASFEHFKNLLGKIYNCSVLPWYYCKTNSKILNSQTSKYQHLNTPVCIVHNLLPRQLSAEEGTCHLSYGVGHLCSFICQFKWKAIWCNNDSYSRRLCA